MGGAEIHWSLSMHVAKRVRILITPAWLLAVLIASSVWARTIAGAGLAGSPHDFTRDTNRYPHDRDDDMCFFCHNGSTAIGELPPDARLDSTASWNNRAGRAQAPDPAANRPLWHQEVTANRGAYAMYQNGTGAPDRGAKASQAIANGMTPGSTSLLCLSCHDGTVAINSYGNIFSLNTARLGGPYAIGRDGSLANHHPIGVDYDAVRAVDREIRSADSAALGIAGTVRDHLYGPANSRMECGTCHSVHNTGNTGEALLWRSDARSALCLTCHDKGDLPS